MVSGTSCVTTLNVHLIIDSPLISKSLINILNVWAPAACVKIVDTDIADIVITQYGSIPSQIDFKPFKCLSIGTTNSFTPNITHLLSLLFDVPVVASLDQQKVLLQESAFRHNSRAASVFMPTTTQYIVLKKIFH